MDGVVTPSCPGCSELARQLAERDRRIADLERRLAEQKAKFEKRIAELMGRVEAVERVSKRQAAPFSKGPPKKKPRKPERKAGEQHGSHAHRPASEADSIDEILDAPLPKDCPQCGGDVLETHTDTIHQEDIPRRPIRRQFTIHCGKCSQCGKACRGRHPLQTSDATASQIGPDAQAVNPWVSWVCFPAVRTIHPLVNSIRERASSTSIHFGLREGLEPNSRTSDQLLQHVDRK